MARRIYRIDEFLGIDQLRGENGMSGSMSPDACNMDTSRGALCVAGGFSKHILSAIPGTGAITRLMFARFAGGTQIMAAAGSSIYAYKNGTWGEIYVYAGSADGGRIDFFMTEIAGTDYLLIACGTHRIIKYDGTNVTLFGSEDGNSCVNAGSIAIYRGRLFAAGEAAHPNRLYWSKLPGGTRSIEDWSDDAASPSVAGGFAEVGGAGSDPICALYATTNQLLIFKERSLYRLIGDRPGNFVIENLDVRMEKTAQTAIVKCGAMLYFMTGAGLFAFNGVTAALMGDAGRICKILDGADASRCKAALVKDRLYFSLERSEGDVLIEYDTARRTYMQRRGFAVGDICAFDGKLYLVNADRYVYVFDGSDSYAGTKIDAYWTTPVTDLYDKGAVKALRELYLRGRGLTDGAEVLVDVNAGDMSMTYRALLPGTETEVLELPLKNEGRTFSMKLYNEAGGRFSIDAGVEVCFEQRRRTE